MSKMTIADRARTVAAGVSLVRKVRCTSRERRVHDNSRSGQPQQLREQEVAAEPRNVAVRLDDEQSSGRGSVEGEPGVCRVSEDPDVADMVLSDCLIKGVSDN